MQYLKKQIKKSFAGWLYREKTAPAAFQKLVDTSITHSNPSSAVADLFTYHGEDGIIQNIISKLKNVPPLFVDIGSGDCIKSNCAALAVHCKWKGIFIDNNALILTIGKRFYSGLHLSQNVQFSKAFVTAENVNDLLRKANITGYIGLLSIDIDGNDYWIWKALTVIQPFIVVIEAKVEFGYKKVVVPYSLTNHHSYHKEYNGASVEALRKLGRDKGYTLIAANPQGYNLFFIRTEDVNNSFREIESSAILQHPETINSFYPDHFFEQHPFITP
jgi:hypothetical protein